MKNKEKMLVFKNDIDELLNNKLMGMNMSEEIITSLKL